MYCLSLTQGTTQVIPLALRFIDICSIGIIQTAPLESQLFVDGRLRAHTRVFLADACTVTLEDIGGGVCNVISLEYKTM